MHAPTVTALEKAQQSINVLSIASEFNGMVLDNALSSFGEIGSLMLDLDSGCSQLIGSGVLDQAPGLKSQVEKMRDGFSKFLKKLGEPRKTPPVSSPSLPSSVVTDNEHVYGELGIVNS